MTPTEQDKEIREKINSLFESVFSQGVRAGKDVGTETYEDFDAWRKKDEIDKTMQLITAHTNKQVEEVLIGFAKEADTEYYRSEIDEWLFSLGLIVHKAIIEAERNRREGANQ